MDNDENRLPANVPLTIEIDEEKPAAVPMTPSDDSEPLSSPGFHSTDLVDGEMKLLEEPTVGSAVASEKAKLRQLSIFLEKWVSSNNNNLYPSRMEKEGLAKRMNMTYVQVNRWFANRRRKVIKRTKVAPSPASVTPATTTEPLVIPAESDGRIGISVPAEHLEAFLHAISAQQQQASSPSSTSTSSPANPVVKHEQQEMVMQQNTSSETPLTPPADDQAAYSSQIVPEMIPYQALEQAMTLQKVLQQLQPQLGAAYNPATLALLGLTPIQYYQAQLAAAQQLALQQQLQAHLLAVHQEQQQHQQQQLQHQNLWMQGGSISASPAHISDSEISEMSELSPPPLSSHVLMRPHSPFKDPHGIADTDMLALMSLSKLSEREQQAVNILLELSTDVR